MHQTHTHARIPLGNLKLVIFHHAITTIVAAEKQKEEEEEEAVVAHLIAVCSKTSSSQIRCFSYLIEDED